MQLTIFPDELPKKYIITYWAKEYNKNGEIEKNKPYKKWVEIREKQSAISLIEIIKRNKEDYKYLNIKIQ